ncbi:1,2-phenylacetyl-CoA epoxidase subunit B [Chitinophaga pendula]|uniref:1,2-phenylacetyl-CoA epoxidase subunit PaaB n=1 Tax=Chitinophaga TaxID=79328 RepID=UPI000BB08E94|nr:MULTISPECIES: 1,2-phenylacetyl-CoA epoxidase subunit PaaB [Chitinophaga]ASZ10392.1 1,2-phenylacetyl-CoA epoxidase subunit B [Chitinophaga sp. MD30]UCJ06643.1 1,2-phenylacetyl-CoA epoxidase subunit B [Chitinophaga pendula]
MSESLDPRINRLKLGNAGEVIKVEEGENWQVYEVFHQEKRGAHHEHVGCVHAPDAQLALVFAKEQFGRRKKCVNLWVVRSADILAFDAEDEDMFANNIEKTYRDASGFKVMDKINKFKQAGKAAPQQ